MCAGALSWALFVMRMWCACVRATQVTAEEREEGLIGYAPVLPVVQTSMVSYNFTIGDVRGVRCAAAVLESSTLVAAWGVDLFYTRHSPSKAYDCLNDDFNYPMLILCLVVMLAATIVTWYFNSRKELNAAWA